MFFDGALPLESRLSPAASERMLADYRDAAIVD